jgi:hypothetical protein
MVQASNQSCWTALLHDIGSSFGRQIPDFSATVHNGDEISKMLLFRDGFQPMMKLSLADPCPLRSMLTAKWWRGCSNLGIVSCQPANSWGTVGALTIDEDVAESALMFI